MSQSSQQSTNDHPSTFLKYFSDMKCALDLLNQYYATQKMSTGSAEIDSLIDGVQEGSFYLFYSTPDNQLILDSLLYRQLIGCILPKGGKSHGFESMAVLFNNIDYSTDKNKHQILNPEKIAIVSKYAGIEPKIVFKNLYVQTAYNLEHQIEIAQEIANKIESNPDIKLVAISHLTRFLVNDSNNRNEDGSTLKRVLNVLYQTCTKNRVAIVATGYCNTANSGIIPRPIGGTYLRHLVNVIVNLRQSMNRNYYYSTSNSSTCSSITYRATMIKHPYQQTPKSTILYTKRIGRRKNPMLFIFD